MDLLPPDPDLALIHNRTYDVRVFKKDDATLVVRGAVRDVKPPGLFIDGDPDPITVHHMVVDLTVAFPALEITDVNVVFETHPHSLCPTIIDHYDKLVGISIARGFTHRVRELFGGPRGCTHTTALLQAMAPAVVQSTYSMRVQAMRELATASGVSADLMPMAASSEHRRQMYAHNLNSCHVWDEDGEWVAAVERGDAVEQPLWITERLVKLGRDPSVWRGMRP
jgi:hypothetical protein